MCERDGDGCIQGQEDEKELKKETEAKEEKEEKSEKAEAKEED